MNSAPRLSPAGSVGGSPEHAHSRPGGLLPQGSQGVGTMLNVGPSGRERNTPSSERHAMNPLRHSAAVIEEPPHVARGPPLTLSDSAAAGGAPGGRLGGNGTLQSSTKSNDTGFSDPPPGVDFLSPPGVKPFAPSKGQPHDPQRRANGNSGGGLANRGKTVSLSLHAIIVCACAVFACITSIVAFVVQYDFFVTEYETQMISRLSYYGQMYGNQVSVMSNSNATSLSQVAHSSVLDSYDGSVNINPGLTNISDFQWYLQRSNSMFNAGLQLTFTFAASGAVLRVVPGSPTVSLCAPVFPGFYQEMTWVLNATLNLWFPITAPVSCADGRTQGDVPAILSNVALHAAPQLGTSTPATSFVYNALSMWPNGTALFVLSIAFPPHVIIEWSTSVPNCNVFYLDDNARLVATSLNSFTVTATTNLSDVPDPYVKYLLPKLGPLLDPSQTVLKHAEFEHALDGFAWGYATIPVPTLSGRPWRFLLVDSTHTELTGRTPKMNGALLIVGATIASLLICALLFRAWFAPLNELAARVRALAGPGAPPAPNDGQKAEPLPPLTSFSIFSEIARAQEAFVNVQDSLLEIQSYIPQTLQNHASQMSVPVPSLSASVVAAPVPSAPEVREGVAMEQQPQPAAAMSFDTEMAVVGTRDQSMRSALISGGAGASTTTESALAQSKSSHAAGATVPKPGDFATANNNSSKSGDDTSAARTTNVLPTMVDANAMLAFGAATGAPAAVAAAGGVDPDAVLPCRMTTLHLRLHRFAKWEVVGPFLEAAATCICRHEGVLDTVDYGSITATFNCHKACPTHEQHAVDAAMEICRLSREVPELRSAVSASPFSIGIDTDVAVALTVGCEDVRARVVIGAGFELARKMSSLAFDVLNVDVLITSSVYGAVPGLIAIPVDYIQPRRDAVQMLSAATAASARDNLAMSGDSMGTRGIQLDDRKAVYEVIVGAPSPLHHASGPNAVMEMEPQWESFVERFEEAFGNLRHGRFAEAAELFQAIASSATPSGPLGDSMRRHAKRLAATSVAQQQKAQQPPAAIAGAHGRQAAASDAGSVRYVRKERCPWDVLPAEREASLRVLSSMAGHSTGADGGGSRSREAPPPAREAAPDMLQVSTNRTAPSVGTSSMDPGDPSYGLNASTLTDDPNT